MCSFCSVDTNDIVKKEVVMLLRRVDVTILSVTKQSTEKALKSF